VANPSPASAVPKQGKTPKPKAAPKKNKKAPVMAKKKKTPKRRAKRKTTHHHAAAATAAKPRKKRAKRRRPVPAGMVLVRASDVGHARNPAAKKRRPRRRHHGHHPQRRNPAEGEHKTMDLHRGAKALAFGTVAAVAGLAGGAAIAHLAPESKTANIAANLAGTVIGGLVGMFDQTAGTLIAHNYAVAAGQWALAPGATRGTAANALQRSTAMARMGSGIATPSRMLPVRAGASVNGMDGIYADNMGDAEVDGLVLADNMGDPDVDGFEAMSGFEAMNGITADTLGDPDDVGEEIDGFDDPFGDVDD
jgi:hypothetical protein